MIIIKISEKQTIEKALKNLKRKWDNCKIAKELRDRKNFKKKSDKKRDQIKRAQYIEQKYRNID